MPLSFSLSFCGSMSYAQNLLCSLAILVVPSLVLFSARFLMSSDPFDYAPSDLITASSSSFHSKRVKEERKIPLVQHKVGGKLRWTGKRRQPHFVVGSARPFACSAALAYGQSPPTGLDYEEPSITAYLGGQTRRLLGRQRGTHV